MIRCATAQDIDRIIDIWLRGSQRAHSFIPYRFWLSCVEAMKTVYLPGAETYVITDKNDVCGFVSLVDEYLAAMFVHP
ncbi:hypothetical protein, partial [Litchfieldella xinjiangensis]|uniref:hypothetical protein n=1 Tax=Litchfieldella xinjiangensis TaxID=1166948 RepID=UPI0005B8B1A1